MKSPTKPPSPTQNGQLSGSGRVASQVAVASSASGSAATGSHGQSSGLPRIRRSAQSGGISTTSQEASPSVCCSTSAMLAPKRPSGLVLGPPVAWLSEGSFGS